MQRNNKKVLLKYNTVERSTAEDDALMFKVKTLLRWFFLIALLFFPFMFYVPLYFEDNVPKKEIDELRPKKHKGRVVIEGWGQNISRSIPLYVLPENDTLLIKSSELCSEPLLLLVVVCSAVNNILERTAIRETWGNYSASSYKLVFLLGTTDNHTMQAEIEAEAVVHDDIIQEGFIDSYNNLTLKSVMLLKFVEKHCNTVKYIFKSDDDMFTYMPNLLALVKALEQKKVQNLLIGKLICGAKPILEVGNKWYTPRYMFHERFYPFYLSGTGYLMDGQTASKLYKAALEIPYLHLEDVFITGLCARKAKIRPRHHSGFSYLTRPLDPCLYKQNQNVITSHRVTVENMKHLWTSLHNNSICAGQSKVKPIKMDFLKPIMGKKIPCS